MQAEDKAQAIAHGTYNPSGKVIFSCPICEDKRRSGEKGIGKCGLCGLLTCDCCLEDHITEVHEGIINYGNLDDAGAFIAE